QPKVAQVITVGRWLPEDARQKNPALLREIMVNLLAAEPDLRCIVVGRMQDRWKREFMRQAGRAQERIRLLGQIPNRELPAILQASQVSLCTSNHESFHISSAEALCCGCSIVAPDLPELPSLRWFTAEHGGRLALRNSKELTQAVLGELDAWRAKARNPEAISAFWCQRLHANRIAAQILQELAVPLGSSKTSAVD
ncbi:MAG: glycosyltransferase, partial [Verrucomicrobia bacterium]|nr:glycosyltransferase [Verrucomicrobiota bacterium]